MLLNGNPLPWVDSLVHLGTRVTNKVDGCAQDMKEKTARYVDKCVNLNQEFSFSHPRTKFTVNDIYNCHFYGFQVWNMFGAEFAKIESTYNKSIKIYGDLPFQTHRNLIEPISELRHMKIRLIKNYLGFIQEIKSSKRSIVKQLYLISSQDTRTTTGSNLRNILLLTDQSSIEDLLPSSADTLVYKELAEDEQWKVEFAREIIDMREDLSLAPEGWDKEELNFILSSICAD